MSVDRLPDWLGRRAATDTHRPALIAGPATYTFGDLDHAAGIAGGRLVALGVQPGARVALLARNGPEFVIAVHALGRIGALLVPMNVRLTPAELAWQLGNARVSLLLHDAPKTEQALAAASLIPGVRTILLGSDGPADVDGNAIPPRDAIDLDAVQGIVYTSGTTGRPKGALLTYGNFWWSAAASALHLGHRRDDRWLAVLPLFHVGGLSILFRSVIGGPAVVVQDGFDPAAVNHAIDNQGITLVSLVANMLQRVLDDRGDRPFPPSLRRVLLGGGPASRPLLDRCLQVGVPVSPTYGLTETASQAATLPPEELATHLGSAGRALPNTEIRIDNEGRTLPAGEAGEIVVRGPTVIRGYLDQEPFPPGGWFHTGDLGLLDADGYLTVLDRRDDLIVSGGENIYPAEVEAVLHAHPGVAEAAVVAEPDERWGSVPVAFVVRRMGADLSEADFLEYCAAHLAAYKRPRRIEWVDALPRNAAGKLLRRELRFTS